MVTAIVMMAGNASRMHIQENKVYLPLGKKNVFEYAVDLFLSYSFDVICVIRKEDRHFLKEYEHKVKIVYGGTTRQESVFNGLKEVQTPFVLIHDAARPFVSKQTIDLCLDSLRKDNACLVVAPCKDSVYQKTPLKTITRNEIVLAQTPQGGRTTDFLEAHRRAREDGFTATDDISLLLKYSKAIVELIESNDVNFKITTQLDYITAKEWIKYV